MSAIEYTRCDGCGNVVPDAPDDPYKSQPGWVRLYAPGKGDYDLCPECAAKALAAVGIEEGR